MKANAADLVETFELARELFRREPQHAQIEMGLILAVGFLIGGGMPHAAGAVAAMFERAYPDYPKPWGDGPAAATQDSQ